jgi:hypothetical protein
MTSSDDSLDDAEHITHTHELLTHAARRAQERPAYVAWALAQVQVREGLSDDALAARLGIATVDLSRLALCLRPRPDHWAEDLAQIATKFGLAPEPLAAVLHTVEPHEAMKLKLLQQAIDEGLASGPSDRSMEELIADAEGEAVDGPAGDA